MQNTGRLRIATAPRPWLTRQEGECAFPVAGEGMKMKACCNPSGAATYCPAHGEALRGPSDLDPEAYSRAVLEWLDLLESRA